MISLDVNGKSKKFYISFLLSSNKIFSRSQHTLKTFKQDLIIIKLKDRKKLTTIIKETKIVYSLVMKN